MHIDCFADGMVIGIQRKGEFLQVTEGRGLTSNALSGALRGVELILAFESEGVAALIGRYLPTAVLAVLDVRELARALDAPSILAMLESHFCASKSGDQLWHRARHTLLENNRNDTENLAFFTEQLVRCAERQ